MKKVVADAVHENREKQNESASDEYAFDRAQPAENDHEKDLKGQLDVESDRFERLEVGQGKKGTGEATLQRTDGKGL